MTIALIAGTGGLPPHLAGSLKAAGNAPLICEMEGFASSIAGGFKRLSFRIETLGSFLNELKKLDVTQICMAGAVSRPKVDPVLIDAATAPLVPRLSAAMAKGDDGTLREIVALFEEWGFEVVGAHELAPELLPNVGVLTQVAPLDIETEVAVARKALDRMGRADIGQAVVVRDGTILASEDDRGTAAMLNSLCQPSSPNGFMPNDTSTVLGVAISAVGIAAGAAFADTATRGPAEGGVLYKAPKPDQILTADMPLIGPETAMQAAEAGLAGIVIPSGVVMVLDLPQVLAILDAQGMFLWVTP